GSGRCVVSTAPTEPAGDGRGRAGLPAVTDRWSAGARVNAGRRQKEAPRMTEAIRVRDLTKTFGDVRALDRLDLTVRTGEVHGFLGPNGAGKSTTIRVLLGLLRRDSGEVSVLGGDPWRDAVELHRRLAYVPGDVNLW